MDFNEEPKRQSCTNFAEIESNNFDDNYNVYLPVGNISEKNIINITESDNMNLLSILSALEWSTSHAKEADELVAKAAITMDTGTQTPRFRTIEAATSLPMPDVFNISTQITKQIFYDTYLSSSSNLEEGISELKENDDEDMVIMRRVLSSNVLPPLQIALEKLHHDPLQRHLIFTFNPVVLRHVKDPELTGMAIVDLSINAMNPSIVAAGAAAYSAGAVALFSNKNSSQAERIYKLPVPVTSVSFSEISPNLLAVGFHNGALWVIDVTSPTIKKMYVNSIRRFEIVRVIEWWQIKDTQNVVYGAGSVISKITRPFLTAPIRHLMSLVYQEKQGLHMVDAPLSLGPLVTSLLRSTAFPELYMAGGSDGFIRVCSIQSTMELVGIFKAHDSVVNSMRAIPHSNKVFASCGSDGSVKLWLMSAEPIGQCLLEMHVANMIGVEELLDVSWSPLNATVVVAVTTNFLHIWDIRRKTHAPVSSTSFGCGLVNVQFTQDGSYIIVGTKTGSVLYIGLAQMPFPEIFKTEAFLDAVVNNLITSGKSHLIGYLK